MSDKGENILRDSQLAFIGKTLAGYTHELKNHLAIINESTGLMGDLLDMGSVDNEQSVQRFKKIITTVGERIVQADTMAKHLNSFGHRMDQPVSVFDVNELLIEELSFLERSFRLKSISLQKKLQPGLPSVCNNSSLLQFILFTIIQEMADKVDSGGEIILFSQAKEHNVSIIIDAQSVSAPSTDPESASSRATAINYAIKKMGVAITEETFTDGRYTTTLTISSS